MTFEDRLAVIEECALAAEAAQLPPNFQWGHDAMEQFRYGKNRAAWAIRELTRITRSSPFSADATMELMQRHVVALETRIEALEEKLS